MPASDTEPENYSIDEMMERLRSRTDERAGEGEPELVTRADGSQMYRVKKRKRRSHQPKKEKEKRKGRMQTLQVVISGTIIILFLLTFAAFWIYLNSSSFRSKVITQMEAWTGAKVDVAEFRVSPASVGWRSLEFTWPEKTALANLKLYDLKGDVNIGSYFSGPWSGTIINAPSATLLLRRPSGDLLPLQTAGELPFQFRYNTGKLRVVGGDPEKPAFQVFDAEASYIVHNSAGSRANLQISKGNLLLDDWGSFKLDFASFQMEDGKIRLGSATLGFPGTERSELSILNPNLEVLDLNGAPSNYELAASHVPLKGLTGKLATLFEGEVDGLDGKKGSLVFQLPDGESALHLTLPFRASPASAITGGRLPMFGFLAERLGNEAIRAPKFDLDARGVVNRDSTGVHLDELVLDSRGSLSMAGKLFLDKDDNLSGTLQIGVPESMIEDAGDGFRTLFSRRERGLIWGQVKISGTIQDPQDDLADRIKAGGGAPKKPAEGSNGDDWKELTEPRDGQR